MVWAGPSFDTSHFIPRMPCVKRTRAQQRHLRYWNPRLASPRHVSYTTVKDYKIILSYGRVSADRIRPIILVTMVKEKVTVNEVTSKNHSSPGKEIVKKLFLLLCEATSQASRILLHLTKIPTQNQSHPANKTKPFVLSSIKVCTLFLKPIRNEKRNPRIFARLI